ncbi:MAG TPA: sugar ABC transporter substrate-binding protein [Spirochaetia bacterium]|nr:sugar ABC transporter substrate-binding protein [Spirochaetia bacterium]
MKPIIRRPLVVLFALLFVSSLVFEVAEIESHRPGYLLGFDAAATGGPREAFLQQSFEWFCRDNNLMFVVNDAGASASAQVSQVREMINSGIRGLVLSAPDAEAGKPIADLASASGVPVFTTDADIDSPKVKLYVGFSGESAGAELARRVIRHLRTVHGGQASGTVLEMVGPPGSPSSRDRDRGFHEVLDRYRKIAVIEAVGGSVEQTTRSVAKGLLRSHPRIDACFSTNGAMAIGVVEALRDLREDPSKVYIATIDAPPRVLELVKSGDIQTALSQTPGFYSAIAAHYLVEYLTRGDSALPRVGEVIGVNGLTLVADREHRQTDIWDNRTLWAPAKVVQGLGGHPWLQTRWVLVTRENANAPYLWGNIRLPALKG